MSIPEGAVVTTSEDLPAAPANKLTLISWEKQELLMFAIDLRERGERVATSAE